MRIDVVAFVSHRKSSLVAGCLSAYARNFASYGHRPTVLLVDSSSAPADRNIGRDALFRIHRKYGFDVRHFSQREYELLSKRLDGDEIGPGYRYATSGDWRIGASEEAFFNRALLACAGRTALFVNVDTLPELAGPRGGNPCLLARPGLRSDAWVPYRNEWGYAQVFKDDKELNRLVPRFHREDILFLFGNKLGRSFGSCTHDHGSHIGALEGQVDLVQAGSWGVSPLPYSTSGFLSGAFEPSSWAPDESAYLARRGSRLHRRVTSNWVASKTALVGRDCFAVSQRWLSCPFLPTGAASSSRGIPGLFANNSLTVEMPWAIRKTYEGAQTFSSESVVDGASGISFHDLVMVLAGMSSEGGSMESVGAFLREVGSSSEDQYSSVLRSAGRSWAVRMRDLAIDALSRCSADVPSLRSDVQQAIDTYSQMLDNADYPMPREIRTGEYAFESERILRRQLVQYGDLLSSWRLLAEEASALRERGIDMGARP